MSEVILKDGEFFAEGFEFSIEAKIIYALVKRIGGSVIIFSDELPTDFAKQGLMIDTPDDTAIIVSVQDRR